MRNERLHDGKRITLVVPDNTPSGAPVKVGPFIGITATAEGEGGNIPLRATVWREGEFDVACADAVAAELTPIYIIAANSGVPATALTTTSSGNTLFGWSHHDADGAGGTKGAGAGTIHLILAKV